MTLITQVPARWAVSEPMEVHFQSPSGRLHYVLLATVGADGAIYYNLHTGGTYTQHWDSFVNGERWEWIPRKAVDGWQYSVIAWIKEKYDITKVA